MAIHKCLEARGSGPGCSECPVMIKGFCNELIVVLGKMAAQMNNKYGTQIPAAKQKDILSETVMGILTNLEEFEGRSTFSTWAWDIYNKKRIDSFRLWQKENPAVLKLTEESLDELKLKIPTEILNKLNKMIDREYGNKSKFLNSLEIEIGKEDTEQFGHIISQHVYYFPLGILGIKPAAHPPSDPGTIIDVLKKWVSDDPSGCVKLFLDLYRNFQEGKTQKDLADQYGELPNTLTRRMIRCRKNLIRILEGGE